MRTLGKTIASLARYRRQWAATLQTVAGPRARDHAAGVPSHLREVTGFGSNPGALRMFAHVPAKLAAAPALVVVLHGCTIGPSKPDDQQTASRAQTEAFCNGPL